jgi:hypothetical protein
MSRLTPARRRWTVDEQRKLDDLLKAGKTAAEIATTLQRTPPHLFAVTAPLQKTEKTHQVPRLNAVAGGPPWPRNLYARRR